MDNIKDILDYLYFKSTKKDLYEHKLPQTYNSGSGNVIYGERHAGPFSLEVVKKIPENIIPDEYKFNIDEDFYNKSIKIGEYKLHIQKYNKASDTSKDIIEFNNYIKKIREDKLNITISSGMKRLYHSENDYVFFILEYHNHLKVIGKVNMYKTVKIEYYSKEAFEKNYGFKDISLFSNNINCMVDEYRIDIKFENFYNKTNDIIKQLKDIDKSELVECDLPKMSWWNFSFSDDDDVTTIDVLNKNIDFDFFIKQEISNNIFKPSKFFIKNIVYNIKKKINLNKFNIKTIKLLTTVPFDIREYFIFDNINIIASDKIVEEYSLQEWVNIKQKNILEKKKKIEEKKIKLEIYNDTYDLMFHGKIVKSDISSKDLIDYLENKNKLNFKKELIKSCKTLFDNINIDKIYLVSFGQYYKYELSGLYYCDYDDLNTHIDDELMNQVELYFDDMLWPDEQYLHLEYGIPEREGFLFGVKRTKKGVMSIKKMIEKYLGLNLIKDDINKIKDSKINISPAVGNGLNESYLFDFKLGYREDSVYHNSFVVSNNNLTTPTGVFGESTINNGEVENEIGEKIYIKVKPIDVLDELEIMPRPFDLELIDEKISILKDKKELKR